MCMIAHMCMYVHVYVHACVGCVGVAGRLFRYSK